MNRFDAGWLDVAGRGLRNSCFHLFVIGLMALAAPVLPAKAGTFYVDGDTGNDLNPGTAALPFATITRGVTAARNQVGNDEVVIAPAAGGYSETVFINDSLGDVHLRGATGVAADVVLQGGFGTGIRIVLSLNVSLESLKVTGNEFGVFASNFNDLSLNNVELLGNQRDGLFADICNHIMIRDSRLDDNNSEGMFASAITSGITAENSSFSRNGDNGLDLRSGGAIELIDLTVEENMPNNVSGVFLNSATSLAVEGGDYSRNGFDGITAINVAGDVTLDSVTCAENARRGIRVTNGGSVAVRQSACHGNLQQGMLVEGTVGRIANSTFSGNNGGLRLSGADLFLTGVTVTSNSSASGGGLLVRTSLVTLDNSIVAGNSATDGLDDIDTDRPFQGMFNLIGNGETTGTALGLTDGVNGNQIGNTALPIDPLLGPIADNGGATLSHLPQPGSPAIDLGNNALALDADGGPGLFDQRGPGFARVVSGTVDIGAIETAIVNQAPTANAGLDVTVECQYKIGDTTIQLDGSGSSDPDDDPLAFDWSTTHGAFDDDTLEQPTLDLTGVAVGTIVTVSLTVSDGLVDSESDEAEVTIEDTTNPVPMCPGDITVEPTGPAGAVVHFAASATDACDPTPTATPAPASGTTFPIGTTLVTLTAMDDSGNSDTCTFKVTVLSVEQVLANLDSAIDQLEADGSINGGVANALRRHLRNVRRSLNNGRTNAACSQLQGFIDTVQDQIDGGTLAPQDGQALIDSANNIRATLGC